MNRKMNVIQIPNFYYDIIHHLFNLKLFIDYLRKMYEEKYLMKNI